MEDARSQPAGEQPPVGSSPAPQTVGPSPAPGTGSPRTPTKLGRTGVIVIIVIGLLWFAGWIAWSILGPDIEVKVREHRNERSEPHGPGRLTALAPDGRALRIAAARS